MNCDVFVVVYGHLLVGQLPAGHLLVHHVFAINNSVGEGESAWESVMIRVRGYEGEGVRVRVRARLIRATIRRASVRRATVLDSN
jgi:hypothetical protein